MMQQHYHPDKKVDDATDHASYGATHQGGIVILEARLASDQDIVGGEQRSGTIDRYPYSPRRRDADVAKHR